MKRSIIDTQLYITSDIVFSRPKVTESVLEFNTSCLYSFAELCVRTISSNEEEEVGIIPLSR